MKKHYKLLFFFLFSQLCGLTLQAQAPDFLWAKQPIFQNPSYPNTFNEAFGNSVATDAQGNSYVTGSFLGIATFGSTTLTNNYNPNTFIAKYDASGNVLWAKQAGGIAHGIAVDSSGNSYVIGRFVGGATFDTTALTGRGSNDIFIVKYDVSGNVLWAKLAGGTNVDQGLGIAVDASGNSYVTGFFTGIATFGNTTLTSSGDQDVFIAKYDASGMLIWANKGGGTGEDYGFGIAVDASGNSFVTGSFSGGATFGSTTLTQNGDSDIFIAKYDASGNVLWAKQAGGTNNDHGYSIAVDGSGYSYMSGYFTGSATFGSTTLTGIGSFDIFIAKYDASGNVLWAKQAGGTGSDHSFGIAVDGSGNSYVTGSFYGSATFGGTTLTSTGGTNVFIAKYDASGNSIWAKQVGGGSNKFGYGIAVDGSGNSFVTGFYRGSATFGSTTLTSGNYNNMFIAKIEMDNDVPTDIALSATSVNENVAANTIVGTLSTTSSGAGNTFTYTLVSGTASMDNASFNISGNDLRISSSPDYESKSSFSIRVRTTDQRGFYFDKTFTIIINDIEENNNPPVTLLYFNGNAAADGNKLHWATANEMNSKSFVVERSLDGQSFETIGEVKAAGNSNQQISYSFLDENAASSAIKTAYYRLKQTDLDGRTAYSSITLIIWEAVVSVYPNPFKSTLTLVLPETNATGIAKAELSTLDGRIVFKNEVNLNAGSRKAEFNLPSALPTGMYLLHFRSNGKSIVRKVIKE